MSEEEADLLVRARKGDTSAFGALVRRYQRRVYATALHLTGNHSDADDVAQEAFVRAFRGLVSFDGRADFFTWLYRITVNTALNALLGASLYFGPRALRHTLRRRRRLCPHCAYPIGTSPVCTECGRPFQPPQGAPSR